MDVSEIRAEPQGFKRLEVWQLGRQLAAIAYDMSATFPRSEEFGLRMQIRRASVSIPSNIAEGWGNGSAGMFAKGLKIARGSLYELDTQLILASDFGYVSEGQLETANEVIRLLGRKLYNLIERVEGNTVRENRAPYPGMDSEQLSPFSPFSPDFPFLSEDFRQLATTT